MSTNTILYEDKIEIVNQLITCVTYKNVTKWFIHSNDIKLKWNSCWTFDFVQLNVFDATRNIIVQKAIILIQYSRFQWWISYVKHYINLQYLLVDILPPTAAKYALAVKRNCMRVARWNCKMSFKHIKGCLFRC